MDKASRLYFVLSSEVLFAKQTSVVEHRAERFPRSEI